MRTKHAHAKGRIQQRGIPEVAIEAALQFGKSNSSGRHRTRYTLTPSCQRKAKAAGMELPELEANVIVVTDRNGKVITVMWDLGDHKRILRCNV